MNQRFQFPRFFVAPFLAGAVSGQELFSDDFNSDSSADYAVLTTPDVEVDFAFDYSTVGIPPAPNTTDNTTLGLRMAANILQPGAAEAVTLATVEEFTGDFSVSFDMWINANGSFPAGGSGSTEFVTAGVGSDGVTPNLGGSSGSGGWVAVTGEGGASRDYRMYKLEAEQFIESGQYVAGNNQDDPLYSGFGGIDVGSLPVQGQTAQQFGTTLVGSAGFEWHRVELTVDSAGGSLGATSVTWSIDGVTIGTLDAGIGNGFETDGRVAIGYMDIFSSVSDNSLFSFGIIDNLLIEVVEPPTIVIDQEGEFDVVNEEAATSTSTFTIVNRDETNPLTVTEVNLSGEDADNFTLETALPLIIPAGDSAPIEILFTASGERGEKVAQAEIVSSDANDPLIIIDLEAFFASTLLAHYKLDEAEGNNVLEASGNGPDGFFIVRDPIAYGEEGLAGGTAIGFTAADAPDAGNFALVSPTHVPTTSISLWIKPSAGFGGDDTLFNRDPDFSGSDSIYGCFIDDAGRLTFRTGGEITVTSDEGAILDDQIHHVVLTHLDEDGFGNGNASRTRMYIDGIMVAENTSPAGFDAYPANASTENLHIATRTAAGFGYDGLIDDIQIYSIELTEKQVSNMFSVPGSTALEDIQDLAITDFSYDPATGDTTLVFASIPNRSYVVEQSDDLENWTELFDSIESTESSTTVEFVGDPGSPKFYRVAAEE